MVRYMGAMMVGRKRLPQNQVAVKACKKCGSVKPLTEYKWNLDSRYLAGGYFHPRCRVCEGEAEKLKRQELKQQGF
jgi:hypothetical protein